MTFQRPNRKPVDLKAIEAFGNGADERRASVGADALPSQAPQALPETQPAAPVASPPTRQPATAEPPAKRTESVLWRVSPATVAEFDFVFQHTNVKSKQQLLDTILLPELARRAEAIRNNG